jgi:hypothetical protein
MKSKSNNITYEEFEEIMEELRISLKRLQKTICETELLVNKINRL